MDEVIKLVAALVMFAFVLLMTYLTTRFVGNYQKQTMKGHNFDLIETYRLTNNKYIQLIRIGDEYVAVAICKDNVTMVCKVDKEGIVLPETEEKKSMLPDMDVRTFSEMFENMKNKEDNDDGQKEKK